jgi:RNA-directed DNA polymerase
MNRTHISLEDIAGWDNLGAAAWRASTGKRTRPEVREFLDNLLPNVGSLRQSILNGTVEVGRGRQFRIRDPKPRVITAPCFRERVLHHAVMWHVGPVLERTLVDDTFACLTGRGTRAAVRRTQQHVQRFPWYAKMDVRQYFASVDHGVLKSLLRRKLKGRGTLDLLDRIIDANGEDTDRGLPIGSLSSQWFANYYLSPLDRFLLEERRVGGMVRYMDDFLFWGCNADEVRATVSAAEQFLQDQLRLQCRPQTQINRSAKGVTVCGYRIFPGVIHLSRTRRERYIRTKTHWEREWLAGRINSLKLQRCFDAALGITADADVGNWLRYRALAFDNQDWYHDV